VFGECESIPEITLTDKSLALAEKHGLPIESWIIDNGVSGTKEPEKRQLGKLLKKIKSGDVIICSELSRLGGQGKENQEIAKTGDREDENRPNDGDKRQFALFFLKQHENS